MTARRGRAHRGPVAEVAPALAVVAAAGVVVMLLAIRWYVATLAVVLALYLGAFVAGGRRR